MANPFLTPLHVRVRTCIQQRTLLPDRDRILIAVSGGQDSLCLLKILSDIAPRHDWELFVLHCNHRWSDRETEGAAFVQTLVREQFQLPCEVATAEIITLDENRSRQWRYGELARWAEHWQCQSVVTGHTRSDRAETFLYNLMRGTGVQGLTSLDWSRPLDRKRSPTPRLVRPLLEVSRDETGQFCQEHQLPVWEDDFNRDLTHPRNRLRHEMIPYLKQHFNPQVDLALHRTSVTLQAESDYLQQQTDLLWSQAFEDSPPPRLHVEPLRHAHVALQRRVVRRYLQQVLPYAPNFEVIEEARSLLHAPRNSRTSTLREDFWGIREGESVLVRQWVP
ncbi:MAG: tRNA lysidine(34) synthetase TilS [Cyanobacteria bacterium J06639_1]